MALVGPLSRLAREDVIERLRSTGSYDPDVLYAEKLVLLRRIRTPRIAGLCLVAAGMLSLRRLVLGWIGVPMVLVGWWLHRRGARNAATVESAYAEFIRMPGG